jgi:hypothetical protein
MHYALSVKHRSITAHVQHITGLKKHQQTNQLTEPVLLNVYGAPELIPRNEFRQPM